MIRPEPGSSPPGRHVACLLGVILSIAPSLARGQSEVVEYYHLDAAGNVRAVTNQAGQIIERHDYLPFGEECTTGACASNPEVGAGQPRKFTGKERDSETGLDYFGARYYGSKIGRFTTTDPAYVLQENLVDPQRWNRYAYARNNPLRYLDPDGRVLVLTGDANRTLSDLRAGVPAADRPFVTAVQRGPYLVVDAAALNENAAAMSANFQAIRGIANSSQTVEATTSALAFYSKKHPAGGEYFVTSDTEQGTLGATVPVDEGYSGSIQVGVGRFLSGGQRAETLAHELRHARRFIQGQKSIHEIKVTSTNTGMTIEYDPKGAVNRETKAAEAEARRNRQQ